jgi:lysophospholipase L1-like esterase
LCGQKVDSNRVLQAEDGNRTLQEYCGKAVLYTDGGNRALRLVQHLEQQTRLHVECVADANQAPLKNSPQRLAAIVQHIKRQEPNAQVVFLQLGCNEKPDAAGADITRLLPDYEQTLFDFPTGEVCTLKGRMKRHKRIAISKANVPCSNFVGCYYRVMNSLRETYPDARFFILSPQLGSDSGQTDRVLDVQLALVGQMLCVPFVDDVAEDLVPYNFVWDKALAKPRLGRMLLLGDSYCEQRKWTAQLEQMAQVELTNLGVSSATMRDHSDYRTNPYTAYPKRTDNTGNHNTLGSQLEKLSRLMAGNVNVSDNEKAIPKDYQPDIILVEGGTNDLADSPEVEAAYHTPAVRADRTNFMGALSYVTGQLHERFPQARIYIVTPGGLYYGHTDEPFAYITKCRQIRRAAALLGYPTVDWDREGRLSFVFNNSAGTGDGTEARPFRYDAVTRETRDLLHPNDIGGRFLAEAVVKAVIGEK